MPMKSPLTPLSPASAGAQLGDTFTMNSAGPGGWQEIVSKVSTYLSTSTTKAPAAPETLRQLTGLLRLQMDVTRYQLRVEVVSKVAESAVTSLRKLQQSQ